MSGQYPPPNPLNPNSFNRPSHLQRTPSGWSSASQPSGLNAVGNFYGSPHLGMPSRVPQPQPWVRPRNPNPLFRMQMTMSPEDSQRIPSEYQQEETMDLSTTVQDVPKVFGARLVSNDLIKNGAIMSASEVNGEVTRTKTEASDTIVTSVIATNPEYTTDLLACSKSDDTSVIRKDVNLSTESSSNDNDSKNISQSTSTQGDDEVPFSKPLINMTKQSEQIQSPTQHVQAQNWNKPAASISADANLSTNDKEDVRSRQMPNTSTGNPDESNLSYLDNSSLSVDTDDSRLVVAESSADDIFGTSPVQEFTSQTSHLNFATASSAAPQKSSDQASSGFTGNSELPSVSSSTTEHSTSKETEPHPSAENVESLLENMFNSQEETACSSQSSTLAAPSSVIVSNGRNTPEASTPQVDLITPMKEEELAKTLSEDSFVDSLSKDLPKDKDLNERFTKRLESNQPAENFPSKDQLDSNLIKEEKEKDAVTDHLMDEIERKLEKLTETNSNRNKINPPEPETSLPVSSKEEPSSIEVGEKNNIPDIGVKHEDSKITEVDNGAPSALPETKSEAGSSCNPFIQVETELEKMFAGIVEPTDETGTGSDNQSQRSVSETKSRVIRKAATKRKRPNSRRASDNSVFGGASSGESTPVKRGRKRKSESGSERTLTKVKTFNEDSLKKGRYKDITSDISSAKLKGPFIRVEGSKESPASVVVVNSGSRVDDDEGPDRTNARRKHSKKQRSEGAEVARRAGGGSRVGPAYSSSTLSARYNSDQADLTWVCVFCQRGPHCPGGIGGGPAGDLFGPYRVPQSQLVGDSPRHDAPSDREVVDEQKRRGGKLPKSLRVSGCAEHFIQRMAKKGKRSSSTESAVAAAVGLGGGGDGLEVWLHGACAQWAPGLCVIGTQLVGLEEAVSTALRAKCCQCGSPGAGLGCVVHNCAARVHYHCANTSGWLLNSDTFIARCQSHRTFDSIMHMGHRKVDFLEPQPTLRGRRQEYEAFINRCLDNRGISFGG